MIKALVAEHLDIDRILSVAPRRRSRVTGSRWRVTVSKPAGDEGDDTMRKRLEIIAAILAIGGLAFAWQQASTTSGRFLAAGIYLSIAGGVVLAVASRRPGASAVTWPARIATVVPLVLVLALGLLAVGLCGPTVLAFDCQA